MTNAVLRRLVAIATLGVAAPASASPILFYDKGAFVAAAIAAGIDDLGQQNFATYTEITRRAVTTTGPLAL